MEDAFAEDDEDEDEIIQGILGEIVAGESAGMQSAPVLAPATAAAEAEPATDELSSRLENLRK